MYKNIKLAVDLRIICVLLLLVIGVLVYFLAPWESKTSRTITVSGEATTKAEPDEFQFNPTYQKKGTDRAATQQELIAKVNEVVAKLKEIGVEESSITLASSTYDNYYNDGTNEITSNTLTITISDKELSQKVQDYLITTAPEGQISPYASFSTAKRKELEEGVRSEAVADARKKAERTVSELGQKLGKVVSIADNQGGISMPFMGHEGGVMAMDTAGVSRSSLAVLPGKQDVSYTVEVTYEIR